MKTVALRHRGAQLTRRSCHQQTARDATAVAIAAPFVSIGHVLVTNDRRGALHRVWRHRAQRRSTTFLVLALLSLVAGVCSAQSLLRLEAGLATNTWIVSHQGQPLLRYVFNPRQYKPYVAEFSAPGGYNLLHDAPFDHLHHHGLMYAITVNGLNFWEEVSGSGIERVVHSATQGLDQAPLVYHRGDKFTLRYLVLLYPEVKSTEAIEGRARRWRESAP